MESIRFEVVPETPEANRATGDSSSKGRRRSSRRSTILHTRASESRRGLLNRVQETPDSQDNDYGDNGNGGKARRRFRVVEESPTGSAAASPSAKTAGTSSTVATSMAVVHQRHPLFQGGGKDLESEDTFVQYVAATQDLASTHLVPPPPPPAKTTSDREPSTGSGGGREKVSKWLEENRGQMMMLNHSSSSCKDREGPSSRKKNNLAKDLCEAIINKEHLGEDEVRKEKATPASKPAASSKRRRSSIFESAALSPANVKSPRARMAFNLSPSKNKAESRLSHGASLTLHKQATFSTTASSDHHQKNVRRSVAGVIDFLDDDGEEERDEDDCFYKSPKNCITSSSREEAEKMDETECVGSGLINRAKSGNAGGGLVDFSSDSAKALIAEYEARFKESQSSGESIDLEGVVVKTKSGGLVDLSSDSAKALIAEYEARKARSSEEEDVGKDTVDKENKNEDGEAATAVIVDLDDSDLPATQPTSASILSGLVVFVEVRTGHENRSRCVEDVLESMGAAVARKLAKGVTHMVFKDGSLANYNRAKKLGVHIVSNMWVEACRNEGAKVSEALFPSTSKERYDSPGLFPKIRKAKSMQPKSEEEIRQRMEEASLKRKKGGGGKKRNKNRSLPKTNEGEGQQQQQKTPKVQYPVPLDYYNSPRVAEREPAGSPTSRRDSVLNVLDEVRGAEGGMQGVFTSPVRVNSSLDRSQLAASPATSDDFNTPLARRLVNKYFSPAGGVVRKRDNAGQSPFVAVQPRRKLAGGNVDDDEGDRSPPPKLASSSVTKNESNAVDKGEESEGEVIGDLKDVSGVEALPAGNESASSDAQQRKKRGRPRKTSSGSRTSVAPDKTVGEASSTRKRKQADEEEDAKKAVAVHDAGDSPQGEEKEDANPEGQGPSRIPSLKEQQQAKHPPPGRQRRHLFTQADLLSETPSQTPKVKLDAENVHAPNEQQQQQQGVKNGKKGKTKLVKASDNVIVALPPRPAAATQQQKKKEDFKVPAQFKNDKKKKKRGKKRASSDLDDTGSTATTVASTASSTSASSASSRASRRSSIDFVALAKKKKSPKTARNCIVGTSLSSEDAQLLRQLVTRLGRFSLQAGQQVTSETSHVVCGGDGGRRTINLLKGVMNGCWVVSTSWLLCSLESGRWVPEEEHELTAFSEAVRRCRMEREAFGRCRASATLMADVGAVYFSSRGCRAPREELRCLAKLAGADVAKVARVAAVVVGEKYDDGDEESSALRTCVGEKWFFDSLQRQQVLPFTDYLL